MTRSQRGTGKGWLIGSLLALAAVVMVHRIVRRGGVQPAIRAVPSAEKDNTVTIHRVLPMPIGTKREIRVHHVKRWLTNSEVWLSCADEVVGPDRQRLVCSEARVDPPDARTLLPKLNTPYFVLGRTAYVDAAGSPLTGDDVNGLVRELSPIWEYFTDLVPARALARGDEVPEFAELISKEAPALRLTAVRDGRATFESSSHQPPKVKDGRVVRPEYWSSVRVVMRTAEGWVTEYSTRHTSKFEPDRDGDPVVTSTDNFDIELRYY